MRFERISLIVAVWALITSIGAAAPTTTADARKEQILAATNNAVDALCETLAAEQITPEITVKEFLEKTDGIERVTQTLRRSQQIGGPRWVDQTCQVRLEISGPRARTALVQIATAAGKKSPLAADVLALRLKDWDKRAFAATGSSACASDLEKARPVEGNDVWAQVTDEERRAALQSAKENAVHQALATIGEVELPSRGRVSDALRDPAIRADIEQWLAARPVTGVEFLDDRQVQVTLSAPPTELAEQFQRALATRDDVAQPGAWAAVEKAFAAKLNTTGSVEGSSSLADPAATTEPALVQLPALPPTWANEQREAEGSAPQGESKLKAARAAEAEAITRLSDTIKALPLDTDLTLGEAAQRDPHLQAALDRAVAKAKTYQVDYHSDGGAHVKVAINLGDLWNELQAISAQ